MNAKPQRSAGSRPHRLPLTPLTPLALLLGVTGLPALAQQAAAPTAAAESPAVEQRQLEGVTVRSRNRIEKLQDVPLSVSVVQGNELERLNATDINSITKRAANVSWNLGNQRTSSLSIRGVGKVGQTEAQDPSVGLIVDGVNYAYNALSSSFDFIDVDTVEVARGPQGTLLGKNTSLGVVNITTRRPSFTPTADYNVSFSQRDGVAGWVAAGGPVIDDVLAWRGVVSVNRQKGDLTNAFNRDNTYTNTDRVSGRVQFLFKPDADFSARLALDVQPRAAEATNGRTINTPTPRTYSNGTATNLQTDSGTKLGRRWFAQNTGYTPDDFYYGGKTGDLVNNDAARPLVTGSHGATVELNYRLEGGHQLTSISAYKDYHFNAVNDEGTPFDIHRNSGGFWNDYKQWSQELRISSPLGGLVDYQAGLYLIKVKNDAEYQKFWGTDAGAWYANDAQYKALDADTAGRQLLVDSLANLNMAYNSPAGQQYIRNTSAAVFGQGNLHLSNELTVTTGLRITQESRRNTAFSLIKSNGSGGDLNPAAVNGVVLGGFLNNAKGDLDSKNTAAQLAVADRVAALYFGKAATPTPGAAYASLSATQKQQVAYAKAIRASQAGVIFNPVEAEPYKATQPALVISPSYKFNPDATGYLSWQHGEKAGISQVVNGVSYKVDPEKTDSFELGLKSAWLNRTLIVNADVFVSNIRNYQQSVRVVDEYTTALNNNGQFAYTSATGNVPKVRVSGIEADAVYAGIPFTQIRVAGAYNLAKYRSFPNAAQPVENGYTGAAPYRDLSGQALAGAPKLSFNIGVDYRRPVFADKEFHTSGNVAFTSSYYSDNALSSYSVIPKTWLADWAIGLGRKDKSFDVSVVVKNLFNDKTPLNKTWNSYAPAIPRTVSLVFTGKV
jgi:iron complex outermembrane recepter protein